MKHRPPFLPVSYMKAKCCLKARREKSVKIQLINKTLVNQPEKIDQLDSFIPTKVLTHKTVFCLNNGNQNVMKYGNKLETSRTKFSTIFNQISLLDMARIFTHGSLKFFILCEQVLYAFLTQRALHDKTYGGAGSKV